MALPKSEKRDLDMMKADERWKSTVRTEDAAAKNWHHNWGWIMDEYMCLQKKLKEKSKESTFLTDILVEQKEDPRKLTNFPNTTNHEYGWLAAQKDFQLQCFGSDIFEPKPLPDIYKLIKH